MNKGTEIAELAIDEALEALELWKALARGDLATIRRLRSELFDANRTIEALRGECVERYFEKKKATDDLVELQKEVARLNSQLESVYDEKREYRIRIMRLENKINEEAAGE